MRSFYEVEDLHPVAVIETVFPKIFDELDDQICFFHLFVDYLTDITALSLNKLMLWQLAIEIFGDLVDRGDDHLSVKVEERCVVTHLSSLLPV